MFSKREVVYGSVFAGVYAALVIVLAPISFLPIQVRIADALIPLSILYGWPAIIGVTVGCSVANFIAGQVFFGGSTIIDVVGGSLANFCAAYVGWLIARNKSKSVVFLATLIQATVISLIVGTYLWYIFGSPAYYSIFMIVLPGITAFWLSVLVGSLISMTFLGYLLYIALSKTKL
ncbi:MAG: QueT transporter family protein [Nitrososphaerota archaeon]|nr:QueT transporter family protein [Candidatus Geocrenenecus dongiae]